MEIDPDQVDALRDEALAWFPDAMLEVEKDLAGHDRLFIVRTR